MGSTTYPFSTSYSQMLSTSPSTIATSFNGTNKTSNEYWISEQNALKNPINNGIKL